MLCLGKDIESANNEELDLASKSLLVFSCEKSSYGKERNVVTLKEETRVV